jgi:hypothetical protein
MSRIAQIRAVVWGTTGLSLLALVMLVVNIVTGTGNQARQAELNQRVQTISEIAQRSRNLPLIRDLVIAAQKEPNAKIRALLAKYRIAFVPTAPEPVPSPAATEP